ncbi:hypothetical protein ACIA5D_03135 [Actinoplanes sp. NPDC051513]|uniref:hypothetical protein n=1 Tax=Actinoplanes sp. NPDC051513 TaxID=3363908 RepID=UPI00379DEBC6
MNDDHYGTDGSEATMNDEYGALLLAPLRIEPSGPPAIDVGRAMLQGGRMRRRRWWFGGGFLAAAGAALLTGGILLAPAAQDHRKPLVALPPDPPMPTSCTVSRLDLGGHHSGEMMAGDHTGHWHVGTADPGPDKANSVLVWHDGKLVDEVPAPSKTAREFALVDVNASGVAVGAANSSRDPAYAYENGKLIPLKGGNGAEAVGINDDGVIAGTIKVGGRSVAVRWRSIDAEPEVLPAPPGKDIHRVWGISQDGTIVGEIGYGGYLWFTDGTGRRIVPPADSGSRPSTGPGGEPFPTALSKQFMPNGFAFGWVYGTTINDSPGGLYRYHPASDTWQLVARDTSPAQLDPGGRTGMMSVSQDDPAVYVGRAVLKLPHFDELSRAGLDSISINAVSDDAHVIGGTAISGRADTSKPFAPVIYRCR